MKNGRQQNLCTIPREAIEVAERAGVEAFKCIGGKHWKVYIRAPDGRVCFITMAKSTDDHRARKNNVAIMKRFARGALNVRTSDCGQS